MRPHLPLLLLAGLLAGCSAPDDPPADPAPSGQAAPALLRESVAYTFQGTVAGASLAGDEGAALPLAKVDTFELPAGTEHLFYRFGLAGAAAGSARVDVHAPDGSLAYQSETWYGCGMGCAYSPSVVRADGVQPGTYEVRYHVAGSFELNFTALAWRAS